MIQYNKNGLTRDGRPWFPVMGEYQYSRSDARYWAEGMAKMKALGADVVAGYSFWIHHEEIEGHYNFRGNNNLRKFVRTVRDSDMLMCLRIGPWVHGEARNGGFPDWIYDKNYRLRSNDPGYMGAVRRYFEQLFIQCDGYLYAQGGPIFAIQVENEYSQWGRRGKDIGDEHIDALIRMLREIGFDVPIYLATGWGQAATGTAVPVWGAYCEAPWENADGELPPMPGYLFSFNPNDENIGSDTGKKEGIVDIRDMPYPYMTVELGSGVQVTKVRRPIVTGDDAAALAVCKLGSGVCAIGYYVFHGGMHPFGALSTMQEYSVPGRNEGGFNCDLPVINYDFQAAIGQYGQITDVGRHLKLYNYFARDFGAALTRTETYLPEDNARVSEDLDSMRYAVRRKDDSGYVFFNNYVRRYDLPDRTVDFTVTDGEKSVCAFGWHMKNKQHGIYPFHMSVEGGEIEWITATPLCVLNGRYYVFWSDDGRADMRIHGDIQERIVVLSKAQALNAYTFPYKGADTLFIADAPMYRDEEGIHIDYTDCAEHIVRIFPDVAPDGWRKLQNDGIFGVYAKYAERYEPRASCRLCGINETEGYADYEIRIEGAYKGKNAFLYIDYSGDKIQVYIDGEWIADHFYTGVPYEIGLRNYSFADRLTVRVFAMRADDFVYVEKPPVFTDGVACRIDGVRIARQEEECIR